MERCSRPSCGGSLIVERDRYGQTQVCLLCGRRWAIASTAGGKTPPQRGTGKRGRPKGTRATAPAGYRTVREVAAVIGLSHQAVQGRLWRGEVAGAILDAGHWIIPAAYLATPDVRRG